MKPRYDANGVLTFSMVLPTRNLAELVLARLRKDFPELNYCCQWRDVRGSGLLVTVAEWKTQAGGPMYFVPN